MEKYLLKSRFEYNDYGLFFNDNQLLTRTINAEVLLPLQEICNASNMILKYENYFYLGAFNEKNLYVIHIDIQKITTNDHYSFRSAKDILLTSDMDLCHHIYRAKQLLTWHQLTLFCGRCGSKTHLSPIECCKICDSCNQMIYPTTSPAIIVLIHHKDTVLLGRSPHFPPNIYSNLAGFIEPGETCEAAVHREVAEEVGIKIKNIQYAASQSWPFPNSFMLGFTAEYESGTICVNTDELEDAQWFHIENLPQLPAKCSIARHLIDTHVTLHKTN